MPMPVFRHSYKLLWVMLLLAALAGCLAGVSQQQAAVPEPVEGQPVEAQFELACLNRGGTYARTDDRISSEISVCRFPDGTSCSFVALLGGEVCPALTELSPIDGPTPTPFPTKDAQPPVTPVIKEPDPFAGLATYLNSDFDFAFRYADTWLVEDLPRLVRLTRPGIELLVHFRPAGEALELKSRQPYGGEVQAGEAVTFFGAEVQPQLHLVDGQVLAVQVGDPVKPLTGGGIEYLIELYSLQSDAPLSEQALAELQVLLSSFELWTY